VQSTRGKGEDTGILRIDFPGYSGSDSLEEISWDEFFEKFDREKLALVYQETTARGQKSNFNKIVSRETLRSGAGSRSGSRKSAGRALSDNGRHRSGTAAKKSARKTPSAGKGSARRRSSAANTSARKSTGRKAAKRGSRSP
jgi:anaerobic selenocysteine-containing dehydrogenase